METPVITLKEITDGMPPHPFMDDRSILWADAGDEWLFRKTTNILVPKSVEKLNPNDTLIRYTACAIKRALTNGGGYDFVLWQEMEEVQPDGRTSVVIPVLCFGPSRMEHPSVVESTADAIMIAFKEIYRDPAWIIQYEKSVKKEEDGV